MSAIKNQLQDITYEQLKQPVNALFLTVIVLQVADALSTFYALDTGQAYEQSYLLVAAAHLAQIHMMWVVVFAKLVVAALFIVARKKSKPTWANLFVMFGMTAFYLLIVSNNIALTWRILVVRANY